ncbi:Six-hairpin glycosidase [Penicillium expansum]|nr:Six-hairpin glycosidase [Penicillium expansum]
MAGASLDWADKPNTDLALSSDEEGLVSSPSTTSRELEGAAKQNLTLTLGNLRLEQEGFNQSSEQDATPTTPRTEGPNQTPPELEMANNPLQLLDLPLDILKEIIKEVTHTTDLTSLALTCSALHSLAIPHMYSRFDIVWPESLNPSTDDYSGCVNCGCDNLHHQPNSDPGDNGVRLRSRRGNHYAQYTRTFSIGNGPLSWVQEYSVTKEVGKMLGTLVALAVARMVNLEAFIWDMPTGVVREIWLALASLADRPGQDCRLERVWVRWHDNSENALRSSSAAATRLFQKYKHVEHPSLSVLPPLKNVAVLDIDEPAYVEELALLIDRSRHRLSELRIGIAEKAYMSAWLLCGKESDGSTSWPRADGVLGILTRRHLDNKQDNAIIASPDDDKSLSSESAISKSLNSTESTVPLTTNEEQQSPNTTKDKKSPPSSGLPKRSARSPLPSYESDSEILCLKVLELERVPLSVPTLLPAVDWTGLTTLTIMRCEDHEKLWRALRRKYAPPVMPTKRPQDAERRASVSSVEYSLNLKHIRTDTVSPYLILFIKDALAPNTLESVYLHEAPGHESAVQIDAIYRHILRKHRQSLRKVLIDATDRIIGTGYSRTRWHKWMFNHDMVSFVTSGKMPQLKELGMAMHYRDWHFFLQRLPNMPQLRALYLPHIHQAVHRYLKELALQVLDIVSIRPDLKIAYIGLHIKCYQILEARHDDNPLDFDDHPAIDHSPTHSEDEDEGWANPNHASDEDSDDSDEDGSGAADTDLLSSDPDDYDTEPDEEQGASRIRYRLQEILFYDEKVSIFKARHGVL